MLLLEELERAGCRVEFVDRPMSQDPHDQLLLQIRGAVAEYERTLIADRMRRGRQQKFRAGTLLPWSRPPYGYRLNPDRPRDPTGVRIEEAEAVCVAEMFALYLMEGQSLAGVVKHVMRLGIVNPSGKSRWSLMTVRGILTNPTYTGTIYAGRERAVPKRNRLSPLHPIGRRNSSQETSCEEWIEVGQVPALVTKEQFEMVQAKLAHNQSFAKRNNTSHQYLLRAMLSCGLCGLSCNGRSSKTHAYYFCRGKLGPLQSSRDETCHSRHIPADQLDHLVWQDICEVLSSPQIIEQALQRAQSGEWLPQELQARRAQVRKARTSLSGQLERLTEAYMAGVLPLAEYKRRRQDLDQRLESLDNQARHIEANVHQQMGLASLTSSMTAFCQRVNRGLLEATFGQCRYSCRYFSENLLAQQKKTGKKALKFQDHEATRYFLRFQCLLPCGW